MVLLEVLQEFHAFAFTSELSDLPCCILWIWKPSVGLTVEVSSFLIFLTMVVFPALSRPLSKKLID